MHGRFAGLRGLKVMALGALVAASLLGAAGPAAAHDDDRGSWRHRERGWEDHGRHRHDWRDDDRRSDWREREFRRRQEWREREAWRGHEQRERWGWGGGVPGVVYQAPPVVYAPPAPAGFEFSVNIPIR